jgi:hypothetical protein
VNGHTNSRFFVVSGAGIGDAMRGRPSFGGDSCPVTGSMWWVSTSLKGES